MEPDSISTFCFLVAYVFLFVLLLSFSPMTNECPIHSHGTHGFQGRGAILEKHVFSFAKHSAPQRRALTHKYCGFEVFDTVKGVCPLCQIGLQYMGTRSRRRGL